MEKDTFEPLPTSSADVPVFNCVVYILQSGAGLRGRVANLAGIEATAGSEREVLGEIVPAFKRRVAELTESGNDIPWIEPLPSPDAGEQIRYIPVHL